MPITLYKPTFEELWFKQSMMEDEKTMSYNHAYGGVIPFPKEKWKNWYERWLVHPEKERFYRYVKNEEGVFVGEIAYHLDKEKNIFLADVVIFSNYRKKGYGKEALEALCFVAKENGISILYDEIAIDNSAISLFLKNGFMEVSRNQEAILVKKIL